MKKNIIYYFIKEELRLHQSLTKSYNYYSYPIILSIFFALITIFSYFFYDEFNKTTIAYTSINLFFIAGIMSGTFGLYARDFLERKFGDIGKLFQNLLIQPIKLSKIFLSSAISDSFFYFFWFILPVLFGYTIGLFIIGQDISLNFFLIISALFSFITGLLISFIISIIYEKNKILFGILLISLISIIYFIQKNLNFYSFSPYHLFYSKTSFTLLFSLLSIIILLAIIAYFSVGREFQTKIKKSKNNKSYKFKKNIDPYLFKDFIDMKRTGDIFAKPFFNVFIPSILVLLLFANSSFFDFNDLGTTFFALIIGTLGVQMFNSLISSDNMAYYKHLPITLENFIKPKIKLSLIICFIESFIILILYSYYINDFKYILNGLIVTFSLLIYNFNLSFYLTGLNPNENLMSSKTFLKYFFLLVPILIIITSINMIFSNSILYLLIVFIFNLILSKIFYKLAIKKWDIRE